MKVICDRGALVEALNLVSGVVMSRTPKPVLTCVKLTADSGGSLSLAATDLEVAVRVSTARVEVQTPGEALVPADKLVQIVRESVDPTLTINIEQDVAEIRGADSRFKVFGYPVADYPPVPVFSGEADFLATAGDLHKILSQTIFATARENSRYAINGVLVERQGNKLSVVATDGRRLALAKGVCKASKGDPGGDALITAIVPTKALNMILRLFTVAEQEVRVKLADNQILFATEEAVLSSNLVEGNFPPYKDVIPRDGDKKATVNTAALASGVRRAALLTNEESKGIRLSFAAEGLTLSSRAPEMGEAEIKVELAGYTGDAIDIGFNPQFILDALKVVQAEQVTIELKAPNKPSVMRTGPDFLYVIMPVNLQQPMGSLIVVHPRFDAIWPFAADELHRIWAAQGPVELIRVPPGDMRPLGEIAPSPQHVRRLAVLGAPLTERCVHLFTAVKEASFEHTPLPRNAREWLKERGVKIYGQPTEGYWAQSVAECALALAINGLRRIPQLYHQMLTSSEPWVYNPPDGMGKPGARGQQFGDDNRFTSGTLGGKRVRVVGMGNVGTRFASFAAALGADVAAWDPVAPEPCFHRSGARKEYRLENLVRDAEVFAPMLPLIKETEHIVKAAHIAALPRGCLVVLVTRAGIVDMAALRKRVLADELALAADVFDIEPLPPDDPLLGRHNVVHTPHLAGRTRDANLAWAQKLAVQFAPAEV